MTKGQQQAVLCNIWNVAFVKAYSPTAQANCTNRPSESSKPARAASTVLFFFFADGSYGFCLGKLSSRQKAQKQRVFRFKENFLWRAKLFPLIFLLFRHQEKATKC